MASASACGLPSVTVAGSSNTASSSASASCSSSSASSIVRTSLVSPLLQTRAASGVARCFSPLPVRRGRSNVVAMATGDSAEDPTQVLQDALKKIQDAWDKTEDKLAVGGLGFAALISLWASTGLISAIDKLPLIPNVFEFVGILFSGWFIYRNLLFKPDREELAKKFDNTLSKITGPSK